MEKYFNIAGPCNSNDHYIAPVISRNSEIISLVDQRHYFVIHAARQTGKTTLIKTLVNHINSQDKYYALYCSLESVQVFTEPKEGIPEVLNNIKSAIKYSKLPCKENFAKHVNREDVSTLVGDALKDFCAELDKPFIIFFDEIDGLQDGTLITFLRQLRDGFINRPEIPFLHSVALVGMRNIRDYKSKVRDGKITLGSTSPFNIITEALTLTNFSYSEIENLYLQHTEATGQIFKKEAVERAYYYTDGQPWLVNAIAREIILKLLKNDYTQIITSELVDLAAQNIMLRRDTHIDSLLYRLKDERIRKIIEPIITGEKNKLNISDDDTQYCLDLGLIKDENKTLKPANRIYTEVIIRTLSRDTQYHLHSKIDNIWIDNDGNINMDGLLKGFQEFWRENSDVWVEKYQYKEAAPHLILQAFLQRIINGGGDILREYAAGRERIDLCVRYEGNKYPIELKLRYSKSVAEEGIKQLAGYMDKLGEKIGWLIIFDRNNDKNWDERISWGTKTVEDKVINIIGC